jgi:transcriptional regulator with XRE-family HTH domain
MRHEGHNLRLLIAERGFTLAKAAAEAHVSRSRLHVWIEQRRLALRLDKKAKLAALLGLSLSEFDAAIKDSSPVPV